MPLKFLKKAFRSRKPKKSAAVKVKIQQHYPWPTERVYRTVYANSPKLEQDVKMLREDYERFGVVIIRNLLSCEEVDYFLSCIRSITKLDDSHYDAVVKGERKIYASPGTVKRHSELWPILNHQKMLQILGAALGEHPRFIGRDSVFVHNSSRGFHRDSDVYDAGFEWLGKTTVSAESHRLIRVMFYLNEDGRPTNRMGILPFSHLGNVTVAGDSTKEDSQYPVWLDIGPGDCLLFDPRMQHSGEILTGPKYAMVLTYGADTDYVRHNAMQSRVVGQFAGYNDFSDELISFMKEHQLMLTQFDDIAIFQDYEERFKDEIEKQRLRAQRREKLIDY